jgi:hypothetical protein
MRGHRPFCSALRFGGPLIGVMEGVGLVPAVDGEDLMVEMRGRG